MGSAAHTEWIPLLVGFAGALIGAAAVVITERNRFRSEHAEARIDDICRDIRESANLASSYWLTPFSTTTESQLKLNEAQLLAAQIRLKSLLLEMKPFMRKIDMIGFAEVERELFDAMTGGGFMGCRDIDLKRTRSVQIYASKMVTLIRTSRGRKLGVFANLR